MGETVSYSVLNDTGLYCCTNFSDNTTENIIDFSNCSYCENDLCFIAEEYGLYLDYISVDSFETVLIILHIIQFITGILGNLLVSNVLFSSFCGMWFIPQKNFIITSQGSYTFFNLTSVVTFTDIINNTLKFTVDILVTLLPSNFLVATRKTYIILTREYQSNVVTK